MIASGKWVERKRTRGYTYRVWQLDQPMPKIEQRYLDCSIYLYDSEDAAWKGQNSGGSGFLVSVESRYIPHPETNSITYFPAHVYAVTNNHVARRGYPVVRLNTIDDEKDVIPLEHGDWIPHPDGDDLAIAPIDMPVGKHKYFPINHLLFINQNSLVLYLGAGDDTFMVGRFINHAGQQRNTPSLRFGSIAMLPFEKVRLGEPANYYMQEAFLVETRSIGGFSGSPVFVYKPSGIYDPGRPGADGGIDEIVGHVSLLGVDCGHVPKYERVVNDAGNPHPEWKAPTNTGMAIVIPAWRLEDLINKPELEMQRKEKDKKDGVEVTQEPVVMDLEEPASKDSETSQ